MNLSGSLESTRLTTPSMVRLLAPDTAGSYVNDGVAIPDEKLLSVIDQVSSEITDYIGTHTLRAERTEEYQIRKFARFVSLDGVDAVVTEVRIAETPYDFASTTPEVIGRDVIVMRGAGGIHIARGLFGSERYMRVTYTGGYFADESAVMSGAHSWLSGAAGMQAQYRLQRATTLGGNVTQAPGGGTQFDGGYNILPAVREQLKRHRRMGLS